jgi:hypothetical protein
MSGIPRYVPLTGSFLEQHSALSATPDKQAIDLMAS